MMNKKQISLSIVCILTLSTLVFAHSWMAPKKSAAVKNPIEENQDIIKIGAKLFTDYCAGCHGKDAKGMSAESSGLEMAAPDLIKRAKTHTDGDFFWKINTGKGDMPSFKEDLEENEIWSLILFVRSLNN